MTTTVPKANQIEHSWVLVDAKNRILGRMATRIAMILRGKHKPQFTPFLDTGDFVVVVNAEKILVTGKKPDQKKYQSYSGYPGGLKVKPFCEVLSKHPERVIRNAVKGMLPKGPLGRKLLKKLKVCVGPEHPHQAQQPQLVRPELL